MKTPVRTCTGCGRKRPKSQLLRVSLGADGKFQVDRHTSSIGRGGYVCPEKACISASREKGGLSRALKTDIEDSVYNNLARYIQARTGA